MSIHTSMYSYCDDIWNITFIDNNPSLIPVVSSTCGDGDHACDATDSTSKSSTSVHTSMYCYCDNIYDASFVNNSARKSHISVVFSLFYAMIRGMIFIIISL